MVLAGAADLLLGGQCFGCDRPGRSLCRRCRQSLLPEVRRVYRSGVDFPIWAAASYDGVLKRLLPAYKDAQALQLGRPLAQLLAHALAAAGVGPKSKLVALPSSRQAVLRRGYAHVEHLTRLACAWLEPPPTQIRVLQVAGHIDQSCLGAEARRKNLVNTMTAKPGRGEVVLCDDIITTGSSVLEAARALKSSGFQVKGAVVVAETLSTSEMLSQRPEGE